MKKIANILVCILLVAVAVIFSNIRPTAQSQTAEVGFFLQASETDWQVGDVFSVEIRLDTAGQQAVTAKAILSYDTAKLKATNLSAAGTAFEEVMNRTINQETGQIHLDGYALDVYLSGSDILLGTITFQALAVGQAEINFTDDSFVVSPTTADNILTSKTDACLTISEATNPAEDNEDDLPEEDEPEEEPNPLSDLPYPDGTLVKGSGPEVYLIEDGQKRWVRSAQIITDQDAWQDIIVIADQELALYPDGQDILPPENEVILLQLANSNKVYVVERGLKRQLSDAVFDAYSYERADIVEVSAAELDQYPRVKYVRLNNDYKVYYLTETGLKRHLLTAAVFNSYDGCWDEIISINQAELNSYPNNALIRAQGDYKVYKIENGQRRWIKTPEVFDRYDFDWSEIAPVNQTELAAYVLGTDIE